MHSLNIQKESKEKNQIHYYLLRHLRATLELYKEETNRRDVQEMLGRKNSQSTDRYTHYRSKAPTKWEVKRAKTKEEENQLLSENWNYIRFDKVHKEAIYRKAVS